MFTYSATIYEKSGNTTVKFDSLVETFKVDESLDSALITIPRLTRSTPFSRFAPVRITMYDGTITRTHYWLIYTPKVELSVQYPTAKYDHTLGLIEATKWLDKFSCGTLTFTQPLGGTRYTLSDVVERLRLLTPFVPYASVATTRLFTVDSDLDTYLDTINAPQLYFDKKNLREALIETFRYVNAIPRLTYDGTSWALNADFVNQRRLPIDISSGIIDYGDEASGENYAHKAEIYHENTLTGEDNDSASVKAGSVVDFISYRNEDQVIIGDSNWNLVLTNNVEKLLSFKVAVDTENGIEFVELIDDYIVEKKVYDTLYVDSGDVQKQKSLYWEYGSNKISAFSETFGALNIQIVIRTILEEIAPTAQALYSLLVFRVEYMPYIEQMKSEQYREERDEYELQANMLDRYSTLQVNPQERINSLFQLTKNVYGQIQRLGVDTVSFTKKHLALTTFSGTNDGIYELGDYTDDGYYITNKEIVYFNNFVIGRYEMSKNFNRIAQFVNIDKEFRPYEITLAKSDFTLRRNIVMPFVTVEIDDEDTHDNEYDSVSTLFVDTFKESTYDSAINGAAIYIGSSNSSFFVEGVYLPTISACEKNTLKFKVDFNDTKIAGRRVEYILKSGTYYLQQIQVPYTETFLGSSGEINFIKIDLHKKYWDYFQEYIVHPSGDTKNTIDTLQQIANKLPLIDSRENCVIERPLYYNDPFLTVEAYDDTLPPIGVDGVYYLKRSDASVYLYIAGEYLLYEYALAEKDEPIVELPVYQIKKDTSEILSLEMSIPIVVNKNKINRFVIGDELTKENALIKSRLTEKTLYWWTKETRFEKNETSNISTTATRTAYEVSANVNQHSIGVPTEIYETDQNFAIADYDGNLYVAVNQTNVDGTTTTVDEIFFNFVAERE